MAAGDGKKTSVRITFDGDDVIVGGTIRSSMRKVLKVLKGLLFILGLFFVPYLSQHFPELYKFALALFL